MNEGDFKIDKTEKVAIVGLGVIGGSIAGALAKQGFENILGIDRDEYTIERAKSRGFIKSGGTRAKDVLPHADIVIICLYPQDTVKFIKDNMESFKRGAVITDVSGIKEGIVDEICKSIRDDVEFVGGHPMAGSEFQGIDNASSEMFEGANYIITQCNSNTKRAIIKVEGIARVIGCTNITTLSPGEHDNAIAFTSHMPHVIAIALMNMENSENFKDFMGSSFKDATRVAQINSDLWGELFMSNKENVIHHIQRIQDEMENIKQALMSCDEEGLESFMEVARTRRSDID